MLAIAIVVPSDTSIDGVKVYQNASITSYFCVNISASLTLLIKLQNLSVKMNPVIGVGGLVAIPKINSNIIGK